MMIHQSTKNTSYDNTGDVVTVSGFLNDSTATIEFAQCFAKIVRPGVVVLLQGEVGAGKTFFARALIQNLLAQIGRHEDVPSPTFTLVQTYMAAPCEIWHVDLYRIGSVDDIYELGLDQAMETAFCLIEWPEHLGEMRPAQAIHLSLKPSPKDPENARIYELCAPREMIAELGFDCEDELK